MRNPEFVAHHRGGLLSPEHHRLLMAWAHDCAMHVLFLPGNNPDERLTNALQTAKAWEEGLATVGECRKASVAAHALARELTGPIAVAVARAVGHAVATAHMADHSLGPALYALKAVSLAGRPVEKERKWQDDLLPAEIRDLVLLARKSIKLSMINRQLKTKNYPTI